MQPEKDSVVNEAFRIGAPALPNPHRHDRLTLPMAEQAPLDRERHVYESHLDEWRKSHPGKFVLIKHEDVLAFFDSLESAFNEGTKRFGLGPFFVAQITGTEVVNVSFLGQHLQSV